MTTPQRTRLHLADTMGGEDVYYGPDHEIYIGVEDECLAESEGGRLYISVDDREPIHLPDDVARTLLQRALARLDAADLTQPFPEV